MPGFACLNAGVVRIGRHLAKRRNIMWRLQFDLSREQNSPDQPGKRVQNGRSATPLIVISRFELPLLGSNQDSPDPESGVLPVTPRGRVYVSATSYSESGARQDGGCARMVCKNERHACRSRRSRPPSTTASIVSSS